MAKIYYIRVSMCAHTQMFYNWKRGFSCKTCVQQSLPKLSCDITSSPIEWIEWHHSATQFVPDLGSYPSLLSPRPCTGPQVERHLTFYLFIFFKKKEGRRETCIILTLSLWGFFFDRILWKKEKRKKKWDHLGYEAKGSFRLTLDLPIFLFLKITNYL